MNLPLGRNSLIKALTGLAIGALAAIGFSQNLVVNGSFESEPASVVTLHYSYLGVGQPAPDGWTFTPTDLVESSGQGPSSYSQTESNNDPNLLRDAATNKVYAEDGDWYVALSAADPNFTAPPSSEADYDELSQGIQTTAGQLYDLSYWRYGFGGLTGNGGYFNATWNGQIISGSQISDSESPTGWIQYSFTVTGTGGVDTLGLHGYNNWYYEGVDNVSLTAQAVPEPSAFAALGLGLVGLFFKRRK